MKSKYEDNFEELQQVDNASNDLEFDRLFRLYLNECHEQGFGLISYTEYHLLHKADVITEAWLIDEIKSQEQLDTPLGTSISLGLGNSLSGFKTWMKGRRKEKIAAVLYD